MSKVAYNGAVRLPPNLLGLVRGLRFRLTLSYFAIFAVLLGAVGLYFRASLRETLDDRMREIVEQEWAAVKGYLRIENEVPVWYFDSKDPEESSFVERLQRIILIADSKGKVLEASNGYRALGVESSQVLQGRFILGMAGNKDFIVRSDSKGDKVLIRSGAVRQGNMQYYLAVGRRLADNAIIPERFTRDYFTAVPIMLLFTGLAGWFIAGRALIPVTHVAKAAQRISGSNLDVRIPSRQSGDELDNLIETFNKMMDRLKANFEQIRQFSTDASHELRTPLTAIRGQLEVALLTSKTTDQYKEAIFNSLQDVEQLSNIVRALLMLSHAETGQIVLQRQPVNMTLLLNDIADQFQIPAEEANVKLNLHVENDLIIQADRVQMGRLFSNLLSNAVKYTPGGGAIDVSLKLSPDKSLSHLTIKDTGEGIDETHLPHIFERFYKVPNANPEKGLGLGLSFVAWIVKAHEGAIKVKSKLGEGTTFEVTLPTNGLTPTAKETGSRRKLVK